MIGALQSGAAAFQRYRRDLDGVAAKIVASPLDDTADRMVDLVSAERGAQVAARVVRAADETLGMLLDVWTE